MADNSVIAEFLVSLGYAVDTSSERRATASAARVQRAVTTADRETTQTLSTEAGRRLLAAAREQGAKVQIAGKAAQVAQRARKQADGDERAAVERDRAAQGRSEANRKRLEDAQRAVAGFAIGLTAAAVAAQAAYLRIVGGLDQMQFASARTGASVSNIEGLSYAFRQLGGTSAQAVGAIEGFARAMRTNPGIQGFVKSLGVGLTDAKGKARDTADVLTDSIDAIRAKHPYYTGAQMAELLGVPEDTFHILDKYAKEQKKYQAERREVLKAIGLDEREASENATKFMQALRSLGMVGEAVGEKLASDVAPAFTEFLTGIRNWIAAHPQEIKRAFESIKDAVVAVGQGLNDVFKTLEPVATGFTRIAESLTGEQGATAAFRALGWVLGAVVIARLAKVLGLLGGLNLLKLPAWLLAMLGISGTAAAIAGAAAAAGAAQASTAMRKGGLSAGVDPLTGQGSGESNPMGDLVERGPDGKSNVRRWVERKWENRPAWLGGKASGGSNGTRTIEDDGQKAGSRSWRNNNPGNLKFSDATRKMGATGADDKGFAIFPDEATGRKAQESLLFDDPRYKGKTIAEAIQKYAPASENNVGAYIGAITKALGTDANTLMSDLTPGQRSAMLDAMKKHEGWREGGEGGTTPRTIKGFANLMRGQYGAPGENLTQIYTPSGKKVTVHKAAAESFAGFLKDLEGSGYNISSIGGFAMRGQANGSGRISQHAYGNAIDINPSRNPYKTSTTDMPTNISEMAAKWGLSWGGDWSARSRDPMHFEWAGGQPWKDKAGPAPTPENKPANMPFGLTGKDVESIEKMRAERAAQEADRPAEVASSPAPTPTAAPPRRFWINPPKASGSGGKGNGKAEDTIRLPEIVVPKAPSPLGASSLSLDSRKSTSIRGGDTTITITGVKDPEKAAAHVGRAVDQSSERNLRNAQTAIR